jgi:nicotinate-nucleotide adenylyltransferase
LGERSIGIMGGTFDPIHNGHLVAAGELRDVADLEQVWLMPNARPPHRRLPVAGADDRMRMVELALTGKPSLLASRLEIERGGISYTIDTVRELRDRFPGQRFELLLGSDAALQIGQWHEAAAVLKEAAFVIFNRPGTALARDEIQELGFRQEHTRLVHLDSPPIAAHDVRERIQRGASIEGLVPQNVAAYIREHHLYGA